MAYFFLINFLFQIHNIKNEISINKNTQPNIYAIGDVMLSRQVWFLTKKHTTNYITNGYNPLGNIEKNSFVIMNLESPFSPNDNDIDKQTFIFASNPKNIDILSWLTKNNTAIVSLANNHISNAWFLWFKTTQDVLSKNNILFVGLSEGTRQKFLEIERNNKKFCFNAYSYDWNIYIDKKNNQKWLVNSLEDAKKDVFEMNKNLCDEKIFILHWGREYKFEPTASQKNLAHFLIDNGATMIIGSHSHIFGKVEFYKDRPIFYSLWNAIFDQNWWKEKCYKNMDCIFDKRSKKEIVPTNIGTAIELKFPYKNFRFWQWNIDYWKLYPRK